MIGGLAIAPAAWMQDVIRVDVERVNVLFSVRDKNGAYINTLTQEDFEVREDGKLQEIKSFVRETDLPLTLGLLVDVSGSQARLIEEERRAAAQFFRTVLREKDVAFLISFGPEAELLQDATSSARLLERGLSDLRAAGGAATVINPGPIPTTPRGTILFDAVYLAAKEKLQSEVGRKAIVLITDGVDQGSRVKQQEAVDAALRADVVIYSIYYMDPGFYGYGGGGSGVLKRMADDTGGRMFDVGRRQTLDSIFKQIEEEMRSQYAISYASSNPARDGSFRKLDIRAKNKAYKVQARKGYFAPQD
jgi:VWFA-related protein